MSRFFERKKPGFLVRSTPWLGGRRALAAALIAAIVLGFFFLAPFNLSWPNRSGSGPFAGLLAAFRAARQRKDASRSDIFRTSAASVGESSVNLVRGAAADYGLVAGGVPLSIRGILNPDDARRAGLGVALRQSDLSGERAAAQAQVFAGAGFFSGIAGAGAHVGDELRQAFAAVPLPQTLRGHAMGTASGRLNRGAVAKLSAATRESLEGISGASVAELAEGHAFAERASGPNCVAVNGCGTEYAVANVGAVYDGNPVAPVVSRSAAAPLVDGASLPQVRQPWQDGGELAAQDAQKCKASDVFYDSMEQRLVAALQADAEAAAGPCGMAGCGEARTRLKKDCRSYYTALCAHIRACPLTALDECPRRDEICN